MNYTFQELIEELTRPYPTVLARDNGEVEVTWLDPLLKQLREAVFGGKESTGGVSGFESKLPIDAAALDLLTDITREASELLVHVTQQPIGLGHVEDYVAEWAAHTNADTLFLVKVRDDSRDMSGIEIAQWWRQRVINFFEPPRIQPIKAECPECGALKEPGSNTYVLQIRKERTTGIVMEASCSQCHCRWDRSEITELAIATGLLVVNTDSIESGVS